MSAARRSHSAQMWIMIYINFMHISTQKAYMIEAAPWTIQMLGLDSWIESLVVFNSFTLSIVIFIL